MEKNAYCSDLFVMRTHANLWIPFRDERSLSSLRLVGTVATPNNKNIQFSPAFEIQWNTILWSTVGYHPLIHVCQELEKTVSTTTWTSYEFYELIVNMQPPPTRQQNFVYSQEALLVTISRTLLFTMFLLRDLTIEIFISTWLDNSNETLVVLTATFLVRRKKSRTCSPNLLP